MSVPLPASPLVLHTVTAGAGPHRVLVLHGLSSSAETMGQITDALAAGGEFTVLAPDLRGHGKSPRGERYRTDDFCADLDELGVWDLVVGHSLGGLIALCAAARPGWTKRLVLLDPALEFTATEVDGHEQREVAEIRSSDTAAQLLAAHPDWSDRDAEAKADALRAISPETVRQTMRDLSPWSYARLLHTLSVPTLVLGADPAVGAVFAPELGVAAAAANPRVTFRTLPGTSHSLHRDAPEAVLAEIMKTLH